MIDRILCWFGWRRPRDESVPGKKSSAFHRLEQNSARYAVDHNRRPERGGTGTGPNHSRKPDPPETLPD
jgi:hypothetical protein